MALNLTDNIKFAASFIIYVIAASWWASEISTTIAYNTKTNVETLIVLKEHMQDCATMHERMANVEAKAEDNRLHILRLENIIFVPPAALE